MNAFPNPEAVVVDPVKLTGYLLSLSHAKGSGKAKWFRRIGFDESTRGEFSLELRRMPIDGVLTEIIDSPCGTKYVVAGMLLGPLGGGTVGLASESRVYDPKADCRVSHRRRGGP